MTELDIESDAFLSLLSEALRAGPGSPQWHDAVRTLRSGGIQSANEYRMLIVAREHLESGKEYRSVRAGPGFTSRLMSAIEDESVSGPKQPATGTTVAVVSAGVMLVVLLLVGYLLWTAGERAPASAGTTLLTETVASLGPANSVVTDWKSVGSIGLELARNSVKLASATNPAAGGGGLYWTREIDPREPFVIAAAIRLTQPDDELVPQIFVTDDPEFSPENSTTAHELVWLMRGGSGQIIVPGGRLEAQTDLPGNLRDTTLLVRLTIDGAQASVDVAGRRVWSGASNLSPAKPRYAGVRFLRRGGSNADGIAFQSVRINMRQK